MRDYLWYVGSSLFLGGSFWYFTGSDALMVLTLVSICIMSGLVVITNA